MKRNKKQELMDEEIKKRLVELGKSDILSDTYDEKVEDIATLYKIRVDEDRLANEQMKMFVDSGLKIAGYFVEGMAVVLPLIFYHNWMKEGFKFEKDGYISSFTFKDMITNFRPRKK